MRSSLTPPATAPVVAQVAVFDTPQARHDRGSGTLVAESAEPVFEALGVPNVHLTSVAYTRHSREATPQGPAPESEVITERTLDLTGATLGTRTVTIPPSDVPNTPTVTISASGAVTEGEGAAFTLSRTTANNLPLSDPLTVSVQVTATGSTLDGSTPTTATFYLVGVANAGTVTDVLLQQVRSAAARPAATSRASRWSLAESD